MSEEKCAADHGCCKKKVKCGGCMGGVYGLAVLGTLVFYIQHADSFTTGAIGFFKAVFWPAFLIYKVYTMLGM